jgi:hypothetical protein
LNALELYVEWGILDMLVVLLRREEHFPLVIAALRCGGRHEVDPRIVLEQRFVLEEGEPPEVPRIHRTFLLTCREHIRGISMVLHPLGDNLDGV